MALYAALLSWWIILQAFSWGDHFWGHEEAGLYFIAVTAPLMLIVGEHHRPGHPAARPWHIFGTLLTAGTLIPLSFHDFHECFAHGYGRNWQPLLQGFGGALALAAILAVAVTAAVLLRPRTEDEFRRGPLSRLGDLVLRQWVPLGVCLARGADGFLGHHRPR